MYRWLEAGLSCLHQKNDGMQVLPFGKGAIMRPNPRPKFYWHESFTTILNQISDAQMREDLLDAIWSYGFTHIYPSNLEFPLSAIFEGIKAIIDNDYAMYLRAQAHTPTPSTTNPIKNN
jgi:hypothetical protein